MPALFARKYNSATHIYMPLRKRGLMDYAVGADWTPAAGDVKVSIDGGAAANIGTLPTAIAAGNMAFWDFTIATGEVQGKKIMVTISDSATKLIEDDWFLIETYGHASAEYLKDLTLDVAQTGDSYPLVSTEVSDILAAVDTEVAAIKAKTDSLTFTQAGVVDANVQRINDVPITGDGSATPFGV